MSVELQPSEIHSSIEERFSFFLHIRDNAIPNTFSKLQISHRLSTGSFGRVGRLQLSEKELFHLWDTRIQGMQHLPQYNKKQFTLLRFSK